MLQKTEQAGAFRYFENGLLPQLLYATKQEFGVTKVDRPMHGHDNICELLLVYRGYGTYFVGDSSFQIAPGDILFYNAGDLHEVQSNFQVEIGTFCFGLTNVQFHGLPANHLLPTGKAYVCASGIKYNEVLSLCTLIFDHMTEGFANTDLLIQTLATSLVLIAKELYSDAVPVRLTNKNHVLAARIKDYIDKHYAENISLAKIAEKLRISPYYVVHVFKDVMGYSPIQYMIRRRIGEAQTLLINSEYSATQIATMVGYDNTNYFCTLFSKMVGLSPIRYRANYRERMCGQMTQ